MRDRPGDQAERRMGRTSPPSPVGANRLIAKPQANPRRPPGQTSSRSGMLSVDEIERRAAGGRRRLSAPVGCRHSAHTSAFGEPATDTEGYGGISVTQHFASSERRSSLEFDDIMRLFSPGVSGDWRCTRRSRPREALERPRQSTSKMLCQDDRRVCTPRDAGKGRCSALR